MRRPITKHADIAHETAKRAVLMLHHEVAYAGVKVKRSRYRGCRDNNADQPIKNGSAFHK
jgi:hypothetical protein